MLEKRLPAIQELKARPDISKYFEEPLSTTDHYVDEWAETGWTGLINLDLILSYGIEDGASDIHIAADQNIAFTVLGDIVKKYEFPIPDKEVLEDIQRHVLSNEADAIYIRDREYDTSYTIKHGLYKGRRFRVSLGKSFGADFLVFRTISDNIPSENSLGIEDEIKSWFGNSSGAVLVCGPTGSGKALHKDTIVIDKHRNKKVSEVSIGDKLLDKDGNITTVLDIHKADNTDKFYKIIFLNGEEIKATGRHEWYIYTNKGMFTNVTTEWMFNNQNYNLVVPRLFIPVEYTDNIYKEDRKVLFENIQFKEIGKNIYRFNNEDDNKRACLLGASLGYLVKKLNNLDLYIERFSKDKGLVIDYIEEIEDDYNDYFCFEVDSQSHSYIVGETFIPTHNSTTMASILRNIQLTKAKKIITIEKPIEVKYPSDGKSMVIQRAVPDDCLSFENGLTGAMRQNPDYILIGEVRNHTEVSEFLRAAETGHLAMSTIHTVNNVTTLNRIRSLFTGEEQKRILSTLGDVLRGVMNQALVKTKDGKSRFAVREILTIDYKIRKLIAEDRLDEIRKYQEDNRLTMEHKLCEAFLEGRCDLEEARSKAPDQIYFDYVLKEVYHYEK